MFIRPRCFYQEKPVSLTIRIFAFFIKTLQKQEEIITEFDETLWGGMVDYVSIGKENRSVTFKDGTEITVE